MDVLREVRARLRALPPRAVDAVLAGFLLVLSLYLLAVLPPEALGGAGPIDPFAPLPLALTSLATVPLVWRRSHPDVALVAVGLAAVAAAALQVPAPGYGLIIALYSSAAYSRRGDGAATLVIFGIFTLVSLALAEGMGYAGVNLFIFLTAWVLGTRQRAHRQRADELLARTEALERERDVRARLAVVGERSRITSDLHDVVAHGVTAMITQATAADRLIGRDDARAADVLADVEATGRASLVELRRLLGLLRDAAEAPALAPQPTLADVEELIEAFRDIGLPVELVASGALHEVPRAVQLSAHRIVQEGLTNVLCHARATAVQVRLAVEGAALRIGIVDDGIGPAEGAGGGAGLGLVAVRERAALLGGGFPAAPRPEGGYALEVELPLAAAP
jgi:signal transduction histidine kinase